MRAMALLLCKLALAAVGLAAIPAWGQATEAGVDFGGLWKSSLGEVRISVAGSKVSGEYSWDGGGSIEGVLSMATVLAAWTSADGERSGFWSLAVVDAGQRLVARDDGDKGVEIDVLWSAVRVSSGQKSSARAGLSWEGQWRTRLGFLSLRQSAFSISGACEWGKGGTIFGSARGGELEASWVGLAQLSRGDLKLTLEPGGKRFYGTISGIETEPVALEGILLAQPDPKELSGGELNLALSGRWRSDLGMFDLNRSGPRIVGKFEFDGGGRLSGTIEGQRMQGAWVGYDGTSRGTWYLEAAANGGSALGYFWTSAPEASSRRWSAVLQRRY